MTKQAPQRHTGALALAGHRRLHAFSRPSTGSPHAAPGVPAHPLPATDLGRLSVFRSSAAMVSMCPLTRLPAHVGHWLEAGGLGQKVQKTTGGGCSDLWSGETMLPAAQA